MYNGPGGNKRSIGKTRHIPRRELPAGARFTSAEDRSVLARPSAGQESAWPAGGAPAVKERGGPPPGDWVRPDLNRSRQHPKLVGFLVGRMMRGPRAQTKLPHGPAGRLEGLRR